MPTRGPYYVDKDAWVAQLVGGSTYYGNGQGTMSHFGAVPNSVSGQPAFKSRTIGEISAADVAAFLADATSVDTATINLTVGAATCMGSLASATYAFLEELTNDFSEKAVSGCNLSSGSGTGVSAVWNASDGATTANRARFSGTGLNTGDPITFDVTALMEARRVAGDTSAFRFRVIAAKTDFSGYDETNTARRQSVYTREFGTVLSRPNLTGAISIGAVAKTLTDSGTGTEGFSVSQSGTSPVLVETAAATDGFTGGPSAGWTTVIDGTGNGHAVLTIPTAGLTARAYLNSVSQLDVAMRCRVQFNKVPVGGSARFMLMARYSRSPETYYQAQMLVNGTTQTIDLIVHKTVGGVVTVLQTLSALRAFVPNTEYWLQMQCLGTSPTVINAKVWRWGDSEPGWQAQVNDSTAGLQDAGAVGIAGGLSSTVTNVPHTMLMEQFEVFAAS